MNRMRAGVRVARALHDAEHAIDGAMKATTVLIGDVLAARSDARLAAEVGQAALTEIVTGLTALNDARQRVIKGHAELAEVAERAEVGWRMEGPMEEKIKPTAVSSLAVAV
jgi:hypothetical protein